MAANGQRIHPAGSRRTPSGSHPNAAVPAARALDPAREHDACGVGFVATASGVRSHEPRAAAAFVEQPAHRAAGPAGGSNTACRGALPCASTLALPGESG